MTDRPEDAPRVGTDEPIAPACVVALLAGGAGSRFDGPGHKLLAMLPADGQRPASSVFARSLTSAWTADVGPVVVVHGAVAAAALCDDPLVRDILRMAADDPHRPIEFEHNPVWHDGQATSLHTGIAATRRHGARQMIVGLADQPGITASAWRAVAAAAGPIVVATYEERTGHPVRLDADVWSLLPSTGDEGARNLIRQHRSLVTAVPCSGSPNDIDTVEDLHTWQSN